MALCIIKSARKSTSSLRDQSATMPPILSAANHLDHRLGAAYDMKAKRILSPRYFQFARSGSKMGFDSYKESQNYFKVCVENVASSSGDNTRQLYSASVGTELMKKMVGIQVRSHKNRGISRENRESRVRVTYEKKVGKLVLNDQAVLSQTLKNAFGRVPTKCENKKSCADVTKSWEEWFKENGTHYASTAYVGGRVEYLLENASESVVERLKTNPSLSLSGFLALVGKPIRFGVQSELEGVWSSRSTSSQHIRCAFRQITGGDSSHLELLGGTVEEITRGVKNWETSLCKSAVVLEGAMKFSTLTWLARNQDEMLISPEVVQSMEKAMNEYIHGVAPDWSRSDRRLSQGISV